MTLWPVKGWVRGNSQKGRNTEVPYIRNRRPTRATIHRALDSPTVGSCGGAVSYERGTPVAGEGPKRSGEAWLSLGIGLQGYLAHKKMHSPRTLPQAYA